MSSVFDMSSIRKEIVEASGIIREEYRNDGGYYHNAEGPALIYHDSGYGLIRMEYYCNGVLHRIDGPARIVFDEDNKVIRHEYFFCGNRFNGNEPSVIWFSKRTGHISCKEYYKNDKLHNCGDIPAVIEYHDDDTGEIDYIENWADGEKISRIYM